MHDIVNFVHSMCRDTVRSADRGNQGADHLAYRVRELEHILTSSDVSIPADWNLRRREAQLFSLLLTRERVTKEMLSTLFYETPEQETSSPSTWESHMSHMRRRLRPFGVEVETRRHEGYRLVDRARWRTLLTRPGETGNVEEILREEIERLTQRVAELETALAPVAAVPAEWNLSPTETEMFRVLLARELATVQAFMAALYGHRDDRPDVKIVNVYVHKLRTKLTPFGLRIVNNHGAGYRLVDRQIWRERLQVRP